MLKKVWSLVALLLLSSCKDGRNPVAFSAEALQQKLYDLSGETSVKEVLEQLKGQKVLIDVWASWCPDCVKSMPETAAFQRANPDVKILMLSVDETKEKWQSGISKFVQPAGVDALHYTFDTGWKKGKPNAFLDFIGLDWIPRYILLDENGKIIHFYAKTITDTALLAALHQ